MLSDFQLDSIEYCVDDSTLNKYSVLSPYYQGTVFQ